MKIGKGKNKKNTAEKPEGIRDPENVGSTDLSKLKKKDLLEIMLRQGEEIDSLRARVEELEAQLSKKEFDISQIGNIAEASLVVTQVFEEAQKAAVIYLNNVKRLASRSVVDSAQHELDQVKDGSEDE